MGVLLLVQAAYVLAPFAKDVLGFGLDHCRRAAPGPHRAHSAGMPDVAQLRALLPERSGRCHEHCIQFCFARGRRPVAKAFQRQSRAAGRELQRSHPAKSSACSDPTGRARARRSTPSTASRRSTGVRSAWPAIASTGCRLTAWSRRASSAPFSYRRCRARCRCSKWPGCGRHRAPRHPGHADAQRRRAAPSRPR